MRISDWSSDVCSSDLLHGSCQQQRQQPLAHAIAIFPRNYAIAKNEPMGLFQILDDLIGMVHRHRPCGRNAQHDAQHHNASDGDGVAGFFKEGETTLTRLASVPQAKIFARLVDGTLFALCHISQLVKVWKSTHMNSSHSYA